MVKLMFSYGLLGQKSPLPPFVKGELGGFEIGFHAIPISNGQSDPVFVLAFGSLGLIWYLDPSFVGLVRLLEEAVSS